MKTLPRFLWRGVPRNRRSGRADTVIVQSTTGHSDDRMTQHYSHVSLTERLPYFAKTTTFLHVVVWHFGSYEQYCASQTSRQSM